MGISIASSPGTITRGSTLMPECMHCGRRHRGECRLLTGECFKCGATDHFIRDCPQRSGSIAPVQVDRPAPIVQRGKRS
ncbi:hypothetical protein P3X46_010544, partial [Hevea brasiliensis]